MPENVTKPTQKSRKRQKEYHDLSVRKIPRKSEVDHALIEGNLTCGPDDVAFLHSIMCQVALPRSKPTTDRFERHCGNAAILLSAGSLWDGKTMVQHGLPYGAWPRLIFAWVNTYAMTHRTPVVPIGDSMSAFLTLLGKSKSGGKTGTTTMLKRQLLSLAACHITLGYTKPDGRHTTYKGEPLEGFDAWERNVEGQRTLWPGTITLSASYYQALMEHAVPLNIKALSHLQGSTLAMDVYVWLAERLHRIQGRPVILHWANLRAQFGQEYTGEEADKNFKKKFDPAISKALTVYPEAKVKRVKGGYMLMASPPPVPYKDALSVENLV